jgi:large subunit ribosomal protein L29
MKIEQLRALTVPELKAKLDELLEDQFNLRFRLQTQPLDDPLRIRKVRKDIARVKTLIREKESTAQAADAA